MVDLLLKFKWRDKEEDEIKELLPILTSSELNKVKTFLKENLNN